MARRLILAHFRAPGDVLMMTPLVRDLKRIRGSEVEVDVQTSFPELWQNNPYLSNLRVGDPGVEYLRLNYRSAMGRAHRGEPIHFLTSFYYALQERAGISVPMLEAKPDIHLSPQEKSQRMIEGRYWVLVAGGKRDMPTKWYPPWKWQEVVDRLRAKGHTIVQCGGVGRIHHHPSMNGVINMVGRTTLRELLRIIYHADGVLCPITFAMHAAAALEKPCVVVAGGREEPWWEAYVPDYGAFGHRAVLPAIPHRFLHTIGLMDCCRETGCWYSAVEGSPESKSCKLPILDPRQSYAGCMDRITPDQIVAAVDSYYEQGMIAELPSAAVGAVPLSHLSEAPSCVRRPPPPSPRFTICVLLYGEYFDLHRRCLQSILETVPPDQLDLRIGANAVCARTLEYIHGLPATKLYISETNRFKYPVMREMFRDPACPLEEFVVWFDDDSYVRDATWLQQLRQAIRLQDGPVGLYGIRMVHPIYGNQAAWFREAPWFRGRPFQTRDGREVPNGHWIHFVTGGWWCGKKEALLAGDVPDSRLGHNGGDITIGEQVHQQGYWFKQFNTDKALIHSSAAPRRGVTHTFPWHLPPYTPEKNREPIRGTATPGTGANPSPRT